jgi:hypothetical protein
MRSLATQPESAAQAVDLVRRYALAQQQRADALAELTCLQPDLVVPAPAE